jgi:hypothetical protein
MNKEQQRIAIAEACGWLKYTQFTTHPKLWGRNPAKYHTPIWGLTLMTNMTQNECTQYGWHGDGNISIDNRPDYLNDLNAMHEAEEVLTEEQLYDYGNELDRVTLPKTRMEMCYVHGPEARMYPDLFRATAAHRAEAFLRTIGKWEESK